MAMFKNEIKKLYFISTIQLEPKQVLVYGSLNFRCCSLRIAHLRIGYCPSVLPGTTRVRFLLTFFCHLNSEANNMGQSVWEIFEKIRLLNKEICTPREKLKTVTRKSNYGIRRENLFF